MNTKLTLKLNETTIKKAKKFARKNKVSLSSLVENYFNSLISENDSDEFPITPTVKELSGILRLEGNTTPEELRDKYLMDKYLDE